MSTDGTVELSEPAEDQLDVADESALPDEAAASEPHLEAHPEPAGETIDDAPEETIDDAREYEQSASDLPGDTADTDIVSSDVSLLAPVPSGDAADGDAVDSDERQPGADDAAGGEDEIALREVAELQDEIDDPAQHPRTPERPERGDRAPRDFGPELSDDIVFSDLDPEARRELRSLTKSTAEVVGRHLIAAGMLIDDDPELALEHARYARTRASRVAVVREAAGIAAYHAGEWAEALGELRAVRRMTGSQTYLPVMVDCERALGRPERALELAAEGGKDLPTDVAVELRIVAAGARRDLGQLDAAVVALQGPDLDPKRREPWSARLFYAYADNLEAAGRTDDAIRWFLNAAEADEDEETDAAERATALSAT